MIILVAYATIEGQTGKIASRIAEKVEAAGHQAVLANLGEPGFGVPGRFDAVVLCGPIHMGKYPSALIQFIQNWKSELMSRPAALVTVSLAIHSENPEEREEAATFPDKLADIAGWVPQIRHSAAGALKYVEYDFFKRWIMRSIAKKGGGPVDTSQDYEFTDWAALDAFVMDFLATAGKAG